MGTVIQFDPDVTAELTIELEVVDPCPGAIVNFDSGLVIHDLIVAAGNYSAEAFYDGPTDSVSLMYGNGYDRCGGLEYNLIDHEGGELNLDQFSF